MDNEMIERCAKAVALTHWPDDSRYKNYIPAVKAAIKAMREPTEKMIDAARKQVFVEDSPTSIYIAMIDAVIND